MRRNWGLLVILAILFGLGLFNGIIGLWMDWLWFEETGFPVLFTKPLVTQWSLTGLFGLFFFMVVHANAKVARRLAGDQPSFSPDNLIEIPEGVDQVFRKFLLGGTIFIAYIVGSWAGTKWEVYLAYQNAVAYGSADPLFTKDIGFYFFTLPFYQFIYQFGWALLVFSAIAGAAVYLIQGGVQITRSGPRMITAARFHLLGLVAAFLAWRAIHYHLEKYNLLFSDRGVVYGASFTDIHAQLPVLTVMIIVSLVAAGLVMASAFRAKFTLALAGIGILLGVGFVGNQGYPYLIQTFEVAPNEINKESPYIEYAVKHTRMAYGIDRVTEEEFPALENLTAETLKQNEQTTQNIRLWDHQPLLQTYGQLQIIRPYYDFVDVDNDRYWIDGEYRQVSLSPRELSSESLPSRIWINEHLTYTHGYGICQGPVNQFTQEGLPTFMIKDIPPASITDIKVTRPEIYYGELSHSYCFVKTHAKEFDYPSGEENVFTDYQGKGGIPVSGFLRKLLFGLYFKEPKIILSSDIHAGSRLMYDRAVETRLRKLLPFLRYDSDPYMVISDEGRLFWIVDAYTVSGQFPYSQPIRGLGNYIRNAVKVTIDAYNGTVKLYVNDPEDLLIQVYSRIYPGVFQPMEGMPEDLRQHLRYPVDLFRVQAQIYATYHMTDPQVFYNKEDLWRIPTLSQQEGATPLEPYYTIMKLNSEAAKEEFILMIPFTPARRENMIAWMAARCDAPNYGQLVVYRFPKQRLVYGPSQIVGRINQEAEISQQLTLWGQGGSSVIRGSLLVIPVEESVLYIQPLYLAAASDRSLPELKRVIVAYGNQIAMEETLDLSLARIFGGPSSHAATRVAEANGRPREQESVQSLIRDATETYNRAQSALKQGDWARYGEETRRLGDILQRLRQRQ